MSQQSISKRKLGRSNLKVTPVGLGAWQFSKGNSFHGWYWSAISQQQTQNIIREAIAAGINFFDTAEKYGGGKSERGLSRGLKEVGVNPKEVHIATKWWPLFRFAGSIKSTIDDRIENLAPFPIDLHQIHQPYSFSFISSQMDAMADLGDQGYIKAIGVSNFSEKKMRKSYVELDKRGYPLASNQVKYNLLDRSIEEENNGSSLIDTAKELDVSIIAYSPLEQGLLTGKFHDNKELLKNRPFLRRFFLSRKIDKSRDVVKLLQKIATEVDATPAQVSLNWLINYHDETVVVIPGASKVKHVKENAGAMHVDLSKEQMNTIEEETQKFI